MTPREYTEELVKTGILSGIKWDFDRTIDTISSMFAKAQAEALEDADKMLDGVANMERNEEFRNGIKYAAGFIKIAAAEKRKGER